MPVSFLFGHTIANEAFSKRTTPLASVSRQAVDKCFEVMQEHDGFQVYITSQSYDVVKRAFEKDEQRTRFENAFSLDKTTQGVSGFTPEGLKTVSESAKTLSYRSYTIVIVDEHEKADVYTNPRIISLTPVELQNHCTEAAELQEALGTTFRGSKFMDYLVLSIFNKEICRAVRALASNHSESVNLAEPAASTSESIEQDSSEDSEVK